MTRHKHAHTGLVTPSPLDRWIDATLRAFAMLVSSVAATLQMIRRHDRVNATRATPTVLPRETHDTLKEQTAVQQDSPIALMLSSTQSVRPSKHERVLTTVSHTSPSPSVSHAMRAIHLPLLRRWRQEIGRGIASISAKHWGRWIARPCAQDGGGKPRPPSSRVESTRATTLI